MKIILVQKWQKIVKKMYLKQEFKDRALKYGKIPELSKMPVWDTLCLIFFTNFDARGPFGTQWVRKSCLGQNLPHCYQTKEAVRLARLGFARIWYEQLIWIFVWRMFIFLFSFQLNDFDILIDWLIKGRLYGKLSLKLPLHLVTLISNLCESKYTVKNKKGSFHFSVSFKKLVIKSKCSCFYYWGIKNGKIHKGR